MYVCGYVYARKDEMRDHSHICRSLICKCISACMYAGMSMHACMHLYACIMRIDVYMGAHMFATTNYVCMYLCFNVCMYVCA
jgi:hypothetical protein